MGARRFAGRILFPFTALALAMGLCLPPGHLAADDTTSVDIEPVALASTGRFGDVLESLRRRAARDRNPAVVNLVGELETFLQDRDAQLKERAQAYEAALQDVARHTEAEAWNDALASAIEARHLTDDPERYLTEPRISGLVEKANARAMAASGQRQWLEAMSLYRGLDAIYDDSSTFRRDLERVQQRVRMIRLYAPEKLQALRVARAERLGEEAPDPLTDGDETWRQTLANIDTDMLRESLAHASRAHVSQHGFSPLIDGAAAGLLNLLDTRELRPTFPGLGELVPRRGFQEFLLALREGLADRREDFTSFGAGRIIQEILQVNRETVKLPESVLIYEMAQGAMSELDDFSAVIWPQQLQQFSRTTTGAFFGVGIQISRRDGRLVVVSPLPNTPAQQAGLKAGDVIATVDGQDTDGWSLDRAVREITGPRFTEVVLGVERVGQAKPLSFAVERAKIEIESVRGWRHTENGDWDYYLDREAGIGYVRLSQFLPQTADELDMAVARMQADAGLNGLVLDLRFNPGGLLSTAVEISDRFIREGTIVSTVGSTGLRSQERARAHKTYPDIPVVVLINRGSASASEIVAGALQDHQRAVIVGTRTFGKGSVQDLFPLDGKQAYLKLTTQHYKLPGGRIIHRKPGAARWGIDPDLHVPMTDEQLTEALELRQAADVIHDDAAETESPAPLIEETIDPQLGSALLLLKTRLIAGAAPVAAVWNQ